VYQSAKSSTTLAGSYYRQQYFSHFGYTDSLSTSLIRKDQLTEYLSSTIQANFRSTNNATIYDPTLIDNEPLNIGRRTYTSSGQYQLQYQATARDQFSYSAGIEHQAYGKNASTGLAGLGASSYTQYSVNGGYNRVIDARTSVGAQVAVMAVRSKLYPDSRTISPSLTVKRQLTEIWEIDGHAGVIFQHVAGPFASSSTNFSYGLNVCGAYPRTHFCVTAQRDTSASGYGALRTSSIVSASLTEQLTEKSRIAVSASYTKSSSDAEQIGVGPSATLPARRSKAVIATGRYDRDLSQRISAGVGGNYQWRDTARTGRGHAMSATIHVTAKLGRL
ncbi:MAG: hypothetical protein JF564_06120, partial [Sphingomonas sp.]|nr:hypothetical protein [Sphingomonas sp.]